MPTSVEEVVQRRLESLDPETMALAEYASCIGRSFEYCVVNSIPSSLDPSEAIAKLKNKGIVILKNGTLEFCHAIFKDEIYKGIEGRWRSTYHLSLGEYYEGAYSENIGEAYYDLARHFYLTREHEKAFDYCFLAAEKAENTFAFEQAITFYLDSNSLIPKLKNSTPDKEIDCLTRLGDLNVLIGEAETAIARYLEAIEAESDPTKKADIHRRIGGIHLNQGDYEKSPDPNPGNFRICQ